MRGGTKLAGFENVAKFCRGHSRDSSEEREILNDLGYRTRNDSAFSDTTIGRLLRDTTAKGIREVDGQALTVERIIDPEIWELANKILGDPAPTKQTIHLFTGIAF